MKLVLELQDLILIMEQLENHIISITILEVLQGFSSCCSGRSFSHALGCDGGGSIRIPASLCGVVGLKTTWGRISTAGSALSLELGSVGPITSTARDAAIAYSFLAGPDTRQSLPKNSQLLI
ncbi:MAG: hypothetical protein Ct9H300mP28_19470 [Pseudomonadota bacterium]|nr:MAG: hypothetical protein Ct9H300mP28_19470 [Pseudomonadota bacterium]